MHNFKNKIKLVIYTSLFGEKEKLGDPLVNLEDNYTDLDISFVCFTDSSLHTSKSWQIRILDDHFIPSDKFSRRVKTMPHIYFPDLKYSLFIDNTVTFKRLPKLIDLSTNNEYLFKSFLHSGRMNLFEELLAVNGLGYDKAEFLLNQKEHYSKFINLSNVAPLTTNTVILREHNHPKVIKLGEIWWEHILNFSKRDQLSFDFVRILTNTDIEYFFGTKMDNDLVFPQSNFSASRILSNFDEKKYSYMNNIKQGEYHNAKNHYYKSSPDLTRSNLYAQKNSNFSMISNLCFSSMTDRFSPRRNLDFFISSKLNYFIGKGSNLLFLFNLDSFTESKFSIEEFNNFLKTVSIFINDASIQFFVLSESEYYNFLDKTQDKTIYDLILLFNFHSLISGEKSDPFFNYLCTSNPNILFFSEASVDISLQKYLYNKFISTNSYNQICYTGYFHDVLDIYVDNSLFYISK